MADPAVSTPPKKHPGERLATYFDNFFKTVVGISTFGASLTFSKVVSNPVVPWHDYGFSSISVQYFLSHAFLFFILDLALTSFAASALTLYRPQAISWFGTDVSRERRVVMWYATVVSVVLFGLLIAAFVFIALVVTAYAGPTGWACVAATIIFGTAGFGVIAWQSPMFSAAIGEPNTMTTNSRMYGYMDEKVPSARRKDSEYGDEVTRGGGYVNRQGSGGEGRRAMAEQYLDERVSWDTTAAAHIPLTPGDHYYEDRRTSRYRRTSGNASKYDEYENERL